MRFASLGSGSRGNAALVEAGGTCLLIDCGFSAAETERRLARLGREAGGVDALLVTHEHGDHIRGVARLARKHGITVWMTPGTRRAHGDPPMPDLRLFSAHEPWSVGDIEITPFPVPHDASEPSQFVFGDGAHRLAVLTDTGCATPHIRDCLDGVDGLLLECNHDSRMLAESRYPDSLKRRVSGRYGHLSNAQAAELLGSIDASRLQHLVGAHLSEQNNQPRLARRALADALGCAEDCVALADQQAGLSWRDLR